jgi:chromosome segregation ATPase
MSDLTEMLLNGAQYYEARNDLAMSMLLKGAADELKALEAERDRLREALNTLDEAHEITQQGLWQDITELRASCESLRETKDLFFRNAEAWEARAVAAEAERDRLREALEKIVARADVYQVEGVPLVADSIGGIARAALAKEGQ